MWCHSSPLFFVEFRSQLNQPLYIPNYYFLLELTIMNRAWHPILFHKPINLIAHLLLFTKVLGYIKVSVKLIQIYTNSRIVHFSLMDAFMFSFHAQYYLFFFYFYCLRAFPTRDVKFDITY